MNYEKMTCFGKYSEHFCLTPADRLELAYIYCILFPEQPDSMHEFVKK